MKSSSRDDTCSIEKCYLLLAKTAVSRANIMMMIAKVVGLRNYDGGGHADRFKTKFLNCDIPARARSDEMGVGGAIPRLTCDEREHYGYYCNDGIHDVLVEFRRFSWNEIRMLPKPAHGKCVKLYRIFVLTISITSKSTKGLRTINFYTN